MNLSKNNKRIINGTGSTIWYWVFENMKLMNIDPVVGQTLLVMNTHVFCLIHCNWAYQITDFRVSAGHFVDRHFRSIIYSYIHEQFSILLFNELICTGKCLRCIVYPICTYAICKITASYLTFMCKMFEHVNRLK